MLGRFGFDDKIKNRIDEKRQGVRCRQQNNRTVQRGKATQYGERGKTTADGSRRHAAAAAVLDDLQSDVRLHPAIFHGTACMYYNIIYHVRLCILIMRDALLVDLVGWRR